MNDQDADGVCGDTDNCPAAANPTQANADGDTLGDACDACPNDPLNDQDADGVCGDTDNCPAAANPTQANADGDTLGDACDACPNDPLNDQDADGVCGDTDNCPAAANPSQADADADGIGDSCDNCRLDPNPGQEDANQNGIGDACVVARIAGWTTGLSHVPGAGNGRLLVFLVGYENGSDVGITAVQYGGQPLTRAVGTVAGTTTVGRIELWYLGEAGIAAASGSTFSVTWGGSSPTEPHYAAATYRNVDQSAPIFDTGANSTNASTPNPIQTAVDVRADGSAVAGSFCGNTGSFVWNLGWTEGTDQSKTTSTSSSADHPALSTGTDTASATHSGPNRLAIVALSLSPGAGLP